MEKVLDQNDKKSVSPQTLKRHRRLVKGAVVFMQKRGHRIDFTMAQLADQLDTNETTLKQAFKKIMGTTLFTYLNNRCMDNAALMLTKGNCVTDVARKSGYSTIGHFSFAFKQKFGICPSLFADRKGLQNINSRGQNPAKNFVRE